jgi:microcystin-dependent protein
MGTPFLGEIKIIAWNFAPQAWAFCNGQFLPINQNQALFSLLGTMYGGNGQTTFALPDFRGRIPLHIGGGFTQGERGGETQHTLTIPEIPSHIHQAVASTNVASIFNPEDGSWGQNATNFAYSNQTPNATMNPACVTGGGQNQPHENMPPYIVLNFIIALIGVFPTRN